MQTSHDASLNSTGIEIEQRLERRRGRKTIIILQIVVILVAFVAWLLTGVIFEIESVHGNSMQPTFHNGSVALSLRNTKYYDFGDIVVLENIDSDDLLKRIVGVPGDTINIDRQAGKLIRNSVLLDEDYTVGETLPKSGGLKFPVTLNKDEYLVMGDNREDSLDSRNFGVITSDKIKAKIVFPHN